MTTPLLPFILSLPALHWIYAHLIGDFLIQNDWMAEGKKRSSVICTVHVLTYMLPFLFCHLTPLQFLLIYAQHWLQDRTPFVIWFMRRTGHEKFASPPMAPWSVIVVDQILHILWMAAVVAYAR
jgi:hypothetical protein